MGTYEMPLHLLDLYFDRAKGLAEQLSLLHDCLSHPVLVVRSEGGKKESVEDTNDAGLTRVIVIEDRCRFGFGQSPLQE